MLKYIVFSVLCIFFGAANAAEITKNPQESDTQFASRYAPNDASAVVHVASAKAWGFEKPVIAAFYEYPVIYAGKKKNTDPKEVLGVLFVPVSSQEYRKFEIDTYGQKLPDGSAWSVNAEIRTVFFANTDKVSDKKLFVIVSRHEKGSSYDTGTLYSTYIYEKPQTNSENSRLVYIEKLSQELSGGMFSPSKYRTASEVKADLELRMLMNFKEDCTHSITRQLNKDRSLLILIQSKCPDRKERNIQVLYQASQNAKTKNILQLKDELPNESAAPGAVFNDLENDGMYEIEIIDWCNANCTSEIYKLAPDRKSMFHYYSGGYSSLFITGGFLVEAGCCNNEYVEYSVYPVKVKNYPITSKDMVYSVYFDAKTNEETGEKEDVNCTIGGNGNPPPEVLDLCGTY